MESFQQAVIEPNSVPQQQLAINVRDVTLVDNHNNKATVLNGLSLDVPRGTIFALLGPSGCGKTSLIQCILGNLKPTTGSINVFGLSPDSIHLNVPGTTVGYMSQDTYCLSPELTIGETLTNFGTLYGLDSTQLSERCQSLVQLLKLPQTDQLVGEMSVDQKRRLSLATALIHKPALILLEEPTLGVEPLLHKSIWQYLVGSCEADQVTVLYTTKYIDEAKNANLIGLMHHGNIMAQGSITALLIRLQMATLEQVSLRLYGRLSTEQHSSAPLYAMCRNINHLPDLCLDKIFSYLPIREYRQVKRVCPRWLWLQRKAGLKVRELTLVVSCSSTDFTQHHQPHASRLLNEDGTPLYQQQSFPSFNSVHFEWLDLTALIGLTITFANVTTLEVVFTMSSMHQLIGVTILLRQWHNKLITFKLSVDTEEYSRIPARAYAPLFEAINSLSSLKHLSLLLPRSRFSSIQEDTAQIDLPVLARLSTFFFYSNDMVDLLLDTFRDNAVPTLRISYCHGQEMKHADLLHYYRFGHQFCGQFDRTPDIQLSADSQLEQYCSHFSKVTSICLTMQRIDQIGIRNLFQSLSQLTQLISLDLSIGRFADEVPDEEDEVLLTTLPSAKILVLSVTNQSNHTDIARLNIPRSMPNLQLIDGVVCIPDSGNARCGICGYNEADGTEVPIEVLHQCAAQACISLNNVTSVHTISVRIE